MPKNCRTQNKIYNILKISRKICIISESMHNKIIFFNCGFLFNLLVNFNKIKLKFHLIISSFNVDILNESIHYMIVIFHTEN